MQGDQRLKIARQLESGTDSSCHGGWPLVGFPSVLAFNPNDHRLAIQLVPARLKPSTWLLSLVRYLGVVRWSIGKAGSGSCDGLCGHRSKVVLQIHISYQACTKGLCAGPCAGPALH